MGCDIHAYVEHRDKGSDWWSPLAGRSNPGRNYAVFARLAGVRNYNEVTPVAEPRGIPSDVSYDAGDYWLFVSDSATPDSGSVTRARADSWVACGASAYKDGERKWVSDPDAHTVSWVTPDEWETAIQDAGEGRWSVGYRALLAAMRQLERDGQEVRVVFWFDN